MSMNTGENEQGLRKIIDLTRMISIVILLLHFYFYCYSAFSEWHLTAKISDIILKNISQTGLFSSFHKTKLISLGVLLLSLVGAKGKKSDKLNYRIAFAYFITGLIVYFISVFCLYIPLANQHNNNIIHCYYRHRLYFNNDRRRFNVKNHKRQIK